MCGQAHGHVDARTGYVLNIELPSMVHKPLVLQPLSNADLAGVDLLSSQSLSQIKLACSEGGLGGLEDRL